MEAVQKYAYFEILLLPKQLPQKCYHGGAGLVLVNDEGDGEDVTAQGHAEAAELVATLSQSYQDKCGPLVL